MAKILILLFAVALLGCGQGAHVFRDLERQLERRERQEADCGKYVGDIVFVLDESGSIWYKHFEDQLNFVNAVVDTFDVGLNRTHVGVETFSDNYRTIFDLDTYTTAAEIKSAVSGITQLRGGTYTNLAVDNMRQNMFSSAHARDWVPHIAFVITDGESHEPEMTAAAAAQAHAEGITVFAIGVGHNIIDAELNAIASQPDYVFKVDSYDHLREILTALTYQACQVTTVPPLPPMMVDCTATDLLDVMFSLPEHAGVIGTEYSVEFLKKIVERLEISPVQTQAGLAPRICGDDEGIYLDAHDTKESLQRALDTRKVQTSQLTDLFDYLVHEGFALESGARDAARKATILLVDSNAADFEAALDSARRLQENSLVILVGVGDAITQRQLQRMSSRGGAFHVDSYEQLDDELLANIVARVCEMLLGDQEGPREPQIQPERPGPEK